MGKTHSRPPTKRRTEAHRLPHTKVKLIPQTHRMVTRR